MRILGVLLIVCGLVSLIYGGITYTKREKVLDVGPISATVNEKERVPLPPVAGGLALAAGVILVFASRRRMA